MRKEGLKSLKSPKIYKKTMQSVRINSIPTHTIKRKINSDTRNDLQGHLSVL